MSKIIAVLACLAVVLAVVSAESKPRYHKLEKLGCSLDQVILCAGEIEGEILVLCGFLDFPTTEDCQYYQAQLDESAPLDEFIHQAAWS